MIEIGTKAPDFTLKNQEGNEISLSDYRGKKVVLYFYPKDDTPGCTAQACGFAENYPAFLEQGAVVIGISKDSVASHKKFAVKYNLPFILLSDTEFAIVILVSHLHYLSNNEVTIYKINFIIKNGFFAMVDQRSEISNFLVQDIADIKVFMGH